MIYDQYRLAAANRYVQTICNTKKLTSYEQHLILDAFDAGATWALQDATGDEEHEDEEEQNGT